MKGQSSIEFMSMISISMILLAALTTVMASKQKDTADYQATNNAEMVAEKLSFQVEMALVQGEGYSRVFNLPSGIAGSNYTVEVGNGGSEVRWSDKSLYRLSRYQGERMEVSVDGQNNVFRVKHNESGVFLSET